MKTVALKEIIINADIIEQINNRLPIVSSTNKGVMPSSGFIIRGGIDIENVSSMTELDNIIKSGIYQLRLVVGSWETLVVFNSFTGRGGVSQIRLTAENVYIRFNTINGNVKWSEWKKII